MMNYGFPSWMPPLIPSLKPSIKKSKDTSRLCSLSNIASVQLGQELDLAPQSRPFIESDSASLVFLLKKYGYQNDLAKGKFIHAWIANYRHEEDKLVGNCLIEMYLNCGNMEDAIFIFERMKTRNSFIWSTIIRAYTWNKQGERALQTFFQMKDEGAMPDKYTFCAILDACSSPEDIEMGRYLHCLIVEKGLDNNLVVGTTLVKMYGKCKSIAEAQGIFDNMPHRNTITWSSLIDAYVQIGDGNQALQLFMQMLMERVIPSRVTFISVLEACELLACRSKTKWVHACGNIHGHASHVVIATVLINAYSNCACLYDAWFIFVRIVKQDVLSWTSIIATYAHYNYNKEALQLFDEMQLSHVTPYKYTFVNVLDACSNLSSLPDGKRIHSCSICNNLVSNSVIGTALIIMYSNCRSLGDAFRTFQRMPQQDISIWTAIITAHCQGGYEKEAILLFEELQVGELVPNNITFLSLFEACSSLAEGKRLHGNILRLGLELNITVATAIVNMYGEYGCMEDAETTFSKLPDSDMILLNATIAMYTKCMNLENAEALFDDMPHRDMVSWNTMIAACAYNNNWPKASKFCQQMQREGMAPNKITFISILDVLHNVGPISAGKHIHALMVAHGFESDVPLASALINMYANCGSLSHVQAIFDRFVKRDVSLWNAIFKAYSQNGYDKEAIDLFQQMEILPDEKIFIQVFSSCSHAGWLDESCHLFAMMCIDHGIVPIVEHYTCIVDSFGRVGWLDEVDDIVNSMPVQSSITLWSAFLNSCAIYGDAAGGIVAVKHICEMTAYYT